MTSTSCNHLDLSEIGLKEDYKLNILARFGGKIKYYLKVAAFCDKVQHDCRLGRFFEAYDLKELHRCLVDILNVAFQELPESYDLNAHFQERYQKLLNAGMTTADFDAFVLLYEELLWDTAVEESLVRDAVQLLQPLRKVFENIEESNRRIQESEESKYNGLSLWELVEQRKQEKIANLVRSKSKRLSMKRRSSSSKMTRRSMEDSQRSVSTEEMTVLSADELYDMNWDHPGYQSWNNVVC